MVSATAVETAVVVSVASLTASVVELPEARALDRDSVNVWVSPPPLAWAITVSTLSPDASAATTGSTATVCAAVA